MAESQEVRKIIVFIGIVLFFSTMLTQPWVYVGQPIPPGSTWGQFAAQASSFPTFIAPNNAGQVQNLYVVNDYWPGTTLARPYKVVNNLGSAALGGCVNATSPTENWFGCLSTLDENLSYVTLNTNITFPYDVGVNVSSPSSNGNNLVLSVTAAIQCRQTWGPVLPLNVSLYLQNGTRATTLAPISLGTSCPVNSWGIMSYTWDLSGDNDVVSRFVNAALIIQADEQQQVVDVSYARVQLIPSNSQLCGTGLDGIACSLSNFAWTIINFFVTLATGVVFIFQVLFWFVGMVGVFFAALGSLFTGSGAPPMVSGLLGVFIIGSLFFIAFIFMGKVRGTGNTG